jgi:hypothetical protein
MELSFVDGFAELAVVATQQRSRSESLLDESGERRELADHTMASHRFPVDHIPHSNC